MTFKYTVIDHDFYKKKAHEQQTMILQNPVSRGSIYSSEESLRGALSVSTNLGNLAIDPSQLGSREKLLSFLADIIFDEYCTYGNPSNCLTSISNYIKEDITVQKEVSVSEVKGKIRNYIATRMDSPVDAVEVARELDEETIEVISSWQEPALYFVVNHLYVNPTKVTQKDLLANKLATIL